MAVEPTSGRADGADLEPLAFACADALESWLADHHAVRPHLWLKMAKKGSGVESVTATEVIDVVLCYGWIDGQRKSLDGTYYLQRISPRRRGSRWSQVNVRKVEALTAAGRMREPGLAHVRAAQTDGRWAAAYPSQREATVPGDLAAALATDARAARRFEQLGRTDRYLVIVDLLWARTPEGRAARLARTMAKLAAEDEPG
ncbi:YdeI/OmpD-associated family protein [Streptomyces griseus]|uniref:YdeI/OmpD-associated family protein n=1 Tax=Streptomyces griseus TaxID=1911 RepID=UPI0009A0A713|nr:YdeI/OmpD-associated family protein [Streptomyces griseus]